MSCVVNNFNFGLKKKKSTLYIYFGGNNFLNNFTLLFARKFAQSTDLLFFY